MNIREKLGLTPKATPQFGQSRSHAMNSTKKTFKPNIQNKTVVIDGKKYKVKLTTREITPIRRELSKLLVKAIAKIKLKIPIGAPINNQ